MLWPGPMASVQSALPWNKQMSSSCTKGGGLDRILGKFWDFPCKATSGLPPPSLMCCPSCEKVVQVRVSLSTQPALGTDTAPLAPCTDHLLNMQECRGAVILNLRPCRKVHHWQGLLGMRYKEYFYSGLCLRAGTLTNFSN